MGGVMMSVYQAEADFVCGHNIIFHDLPRLSELNGPEDYERKVIDTLFLSPIAIRETKTIT